MKPLRFHSGRPPITAFSTARVFADGPGTFILRRSQLLSLHLQLIPLLPLPLAIPDKGTGRLFPDSSLRRILGLGALQPPRWYSQARLLTRHRFFGQSPVPKSAPVRLVAPAPPRPYLRQRRNNQRLRRCQKVPEKTRLGICGMNHEPT